MSARGWLYLVLALLVLALGGVGYLFWVQNSGQEITVSLELWMIGRYGGTFSPSELMAVSGVVGFGLGFFPMLLRGFGRGRRIRQLEQQVAMSSTADNASSSSWR